MESNKPNHGLCRKVISWILLGLFNAIIFGLSLIAKIDVFTSYMKPVVILDLIVVCVALAGFGEPSEQLFYLLSFVFDCMAYFRPKPDKTRGSDKASRKRPKGDQRKKADGEEEVDKEEEVDEEEDEQLEAIALRKMKGKGREGEQDVRDEHVDV